MPIAEFHTPDTLRRREGFRNLGQDVLGEKFDAAKSVAALLANAGKEVGVALLTQSIIAGLGNVFKSEVCFACRINPFRRIETLSVQEADSLVVRGPRIASRKCQGKFRTRESDNRSSSQNGQLKQGRAFVGLREAREILPRMRLLDRIPQTA